MLGGGGRWQRGPIWGPSGGRRAMHACMHGARAIAGQAASGPVPAPSASTSPPQQASTRQANAGQRARADPAPALQAPVGLHHLSFRSARCLAAPRLPPWLLPSSEETPSAHAPTPRVRCDSAKYAGAGEVGLEADIEGPDAERVMSDPPKCRKEFTRNAPGGRVRNRWQGMVLSRRCHLACANG